MPIMSMFHRGVALPSAAKKKSGLSFVTIVLTVLMFGLVWEAFHIVIVNGLDVPEAITRDGGKTISYYIVPTKDGKGSRKVFPNSPEFMKIMRSDKYDLVHVPSSETLETLNKQGEKN